MDQRVHMFGERLRREREMRGISVDEIALATKIGKRLLRALEQGKVDLLPGGIFNKSYVRAYADYLGIDAEEAVAEYLAAVGDGVSPVRASAEESLAGAPIMEPHEGTLGLRRAAFPVIPALILTLVVASAAGGWQVYRQRHQEQRQFARRTGNMPVRALEQPAPANIRSLRPSAPPSQAGQDLAHRRDIGPMLPSASAGRIKPAAEIMNSAASAPSKQGQQNAPSEQSQPVAPRQEATSESATAVPALASDNSTDGAGPLELTIRAKDRARVTVKSDGRVMVRGLLNPPEVKTVRASNQVVFWTANASQVELSFNGKNIPTHHPGESDEQLLVFDSRGLLPHQ